jgi:hypothetical protein
MTTYQIENRSTTGPFDISEVNAVQPFINLGSIKITPRVGLQLKLDIDDATKKVVAATLDCDGSTLQVQAFAAPRSAGLWAEIRSQVVEQVSKQGGQASEVDGPFGVEVRATLPTQDGVIRPVRFIGVDGPNWFLRGVVSGKGAATPSDALAIEDVFRSVVVDRGNQALPPRELLLLTVPVQAGSAG